MYVEYFLHHLHTKQGFIRTTLRIELEEIVSFRINVFYLLLDCLLNDKFEIMPSICILSVVTKCLIDYTLVNIVLQFR